MSMSPNTAGVVLGLVVAALIVVVTIIRQKRFEATDLGSFVAAFLSATNVPPAIFLCFYGLSPDPDTVQTKLHGYEKFVSFAGLSLLLVSLIALWGLFSRAYQRAAVEDTSRNSIGQENPAA
jgi:hypothetical protein